MKASINFDPATDELLIKLPAAAWRAAQQQGDFHGGERAIRRLLSAAGQELTATWLRAQDVDVAQLELAGETWYRKDPSAGHYQTLYGAVVVERHLYQTSAGGATLCPLELNCQLQFGSATPLLAEIVSFKLASATAREVEQDLAKSHGLQLSDSYLQTLGQQVGARAVVPAQAWVRPLPAAPAPVTFIASGVDGTTMPLVGEDYKEAMCGTLALYNLAGERLTTEYHGAMPQAGKADFETAFAARTQQLLAHFPNALHVCLGDGAKWNWEFFRRHFPWALLILDFFHAAAHLHRAAELVFGVGPQAQRYYEKWRAKLLTAPGAVGRMVRSLLRHARGRQLAAKAWRALQTELNYFRHNAELMRYAEFRAADLPIGSGVTEAGCKELIKARFCRSGMHWYRATGAPLLELRAIKLSQQWDGFWANVMLAAT